NGHYHPEGAMGLRKKERARKPTQRRRSIRRKVRKATASRAELREHLDLATVIDISQALSGEIIVEKLIDRFMRAAIEQPPAKRAVLVAVRDEELRTSAEAVVHGKEITIKVRQHPARDAAALPDSLIRYTIRTRDPVVLDDAMAQSQFSADPHIVMHHVRSIL